MRAPIKAAARAVIAVLTFGWQRLVAAVVRQMWSGVRDASSDTS